MPEALMVTCPLSPPSPNRLPKPPPAAAADTAAAAGAGVAAAVTSSSSTRSQAGNNNPGASKRGVAFLLQRKRESDTRPVEITERSVCAFLRLGRGGKPKHDSSNVMKQVRNSFNSESRANKKLADVKSMDAWNEGKEGDVQTVDVGAKKKDSTKGTKKRQDSERLLVAEILCKSECCVEKSGRKMWLNVLWDVLPSVTTMLVTEDRSDKAQQTSEEKDLDELVDEIISAAKETAADDGIGLHEMAQPEEEQPEMQAIETGEMEADLADGVADEGDENEGSQVENGDESQRASGGVEDAAPEATEVEVVVGRQKKARRVKKVPVHKLAMTDLDVLGKEKMHKMNLVATRLRKTKRKAREYKALHVNLRERLMASRESGRGGNRFDEVIDTSTTPQESTRRSQLLSKIVSFAG